jgi:hypothetical protein
VPILLTPLAQGSTLFMGLVCLAALVFGRWPERIGGATVLANWCLSTLAQDRRWRHHGQPVMFALDAAMLLVLVALALGCRRTWVLWAAACALLLNITHLAGTLDVRIGQWSYLTALYVWELTLILTLAVGTAMEGRRPAESTDLALARRIR